MGIRFRCHHCEFELHVKDFQAGKRGRCPECKGKFRIPLEDAEHSQELEGQPAQPNPPNETTPGPSKPAASTRTQSTPSDAASPQPNSSQTTLQPPADSNAAAAVASEGSPQVSSNPNHASEEKTDSPPTAANQPIESRALAEAPDATWYVRPTSGGQYGPASSAVVFQWLAENRVGRDALVWRDDWPDWQPAAGVFEDFFANSAGGSEPGGEKTAPQLESALHPTSAGATIPAGSLSDRNRAARKNKRRRNYIAMISVLTVTMIGLVVTLVVVLLMQNNQ